MIGFRKFVCVVITLSQLIFIGILFPQDYLLVYNSEKIFKPDFQDLDKSIQLAEELVEKNEQLKAIKQYEKIVEEYPDHLSSWRRLAQLYTWNSMNEKAVACYEKIVRLNPVDSETMKTLAQQYIWADKQLKAIDLLENVLVLEQDNLEVHHQLAQLYSWNNMNDLAVKQYERIVKLDPTDTKTKKILAKNYFWSNRVKDGIRILENVLELEPDSVSIREELAQQYVWNNMNKKAIGQYEEILKLQPDNFEVQKKLAQQYMWNNRPADAAILYEQLLETEPQNDFFKKQLSNAFIWSGQGNKAEKILLKILNEQPYNKEILWSLAELQRWSGKWDLAKTNLNKLLKFEPNNKKARDMLIGIRREYGTFLEARYNRISDSNKLTREQIPVGVTCFCSRFWEYQFKAARNRIWDGRLDSSLVGYGGLMSSKFNFTTNTSMLVEIAATHYSSSWTPLAFRMQINQKFFNRLHTNVRYTRSESREGVRAITNKIMLGGVKGEFYWQLTKRLSLSGLYSDVSYSDDNNKKTATLASYFSMKLKNPRLVFFVYYSYEDFKKIYSSSLPYWTPDELATSAVGFNVEHEFSNFINASAGYSLVNQQSIYSHNFSGKLGIYFMKYNGVFIEFLKNGSDVYNAESVSVYYQHRF
ncbi:hypothetical protein B6I21_00395 [candidate division KSB1 bacterium 4572_119]|nr:MAG: hypothetical protein B6I21_00395 [candidate division KSB1 bacterium 4572_119]